MENLVQNFEFNDPVDNVNVVEAKPFIGATEHYKMFQIIPTVWIAPYRYYREMSDIENNNQNGTLEGAIYDKDYLSTDEQKNQFLKNMIVLFKRIENCESGLQFLKKLMYALPFPEKNKEGKYDPVVMEIQSDSNVKYKLKNILIFGPGLDLTSNNYNAFPGSTNGKGMYGEIQFNPNIEIGFGKFVQDPAVSLFHELTHALHGLYGISTNDEIKLNVSFSKNIIGMDKKNNIYQSLEETLVLGGRDAKIIKLGSPDYKAYENTCIYNYKNACDELFQAAKEDFSDGRVYDFLNIKYGIEEKNGKKTAVNGKTAENKVRALLNTTETSFCQQLKNSEGRIGIPYRKHYSSDVLEYYGIDLDKNYTFEEGFSSGQKKKLYKNSLLTSKKIPIINVHWSHKISDELIQKEYTASIFKEDCGKIVPKSFFENIDFSNIMNPSTNSSKFNFFSNENTEFFKDETFPISPTILRNFTVDKSDQIKLVPIPRHNNSTNSININVDQPTSYHYLLAQEFDSQIDTKRDRISLSNSFDETVNNQKKVYSYFPRVIQSANSDLKDIDKVTNIQLNFQTWIKTVINDFTIDAEKKELNDKIADAVSIVPWVGPALNLANEAIFHHNLKSALELGGIMVLLEIAPEFAFPLAIYAKITADLQAMEEKKIENFVNTALANRKKLWEEMYNFAIYQWWENYYLQFAHRLSQVKQSLENQIKAIKAIIEYQFNQIQDKLNTKEKQELLMVINGAEERLYKSAQVALRNVGDFFEASQVNYFEKTILPMVIAKMAKTDTEIFTDLKNKLSVNNDILNKYYKKLYKEFIVNPKPSFDWREFPNIQALMDELSFINQKNAILSLKVDQSKVIDATGSFENIKTYGNIITSGRGEKALKIASNTTDSIEIVNNSISKFGPLQDFTVSFWIRIPRLSKIPKESATIIANSKSPEELGWSLVLQNESLIWKITDGKHTEELITSNLRDNRWHHIVIVHNRLDKMYMYLDGEKKYSKVINQVANLNTNENIVMKYNSTETGFFIKIQDFNIFGKCFYEEDVYSLYDKYFESGIIRDWWGEEVKYNTEYYLQNKAFPGQGVNWKSSYGISYVKLNTSKGKRSILYDGLKIKLEPLGYAEGSVGYRDNNKIKLADESSTLKYFTIESTDSSKRWIRLNDNDWASHCTFLPGTHMSMNSPYFKIMLPSDKKSGIMKQADKKEFWLWSNTSSEYLTKYPRYIYDDIHWRLIPKDEGWYE
ncbi:TPA: hypothetical protein QCY38_005223 [Bacillus toyonensis]|nr:hypothetical protein [Bacillus toyonensis]